MWYRRNKPVNQKKKNRITNAQIAENYFSFDTSFFKCTRTLERKKNVPTLNIEHGCWKYI